MLTDVLERRVDRENEASSNPRRNEEELEEWLNQEWEYENPTPALVLKPMRKKLIPKFEPVDISSSEEEEEGEEDNKLIDL